MKTCKGCGQNKNLTEFNAHPATKDRLKPKCKICESVYNKSWRAKNPDKARDHSIRQSQALRERNPEYWKDWFRKNYGTEDGRIKWVARSANRRAAIANAEGTYTAGEFKALCELYGNRCLACLRESVVLTVDHVEPISKGGSNTIENIQPLCAACNSRKGIRNTDYRVRFAF